MKSITQVVGYAANDGIEWCVLTNGIRYRVYKASEKASAPEKLLFEVSIDHRDSTGLSVEQIAAQLSRLSRDSMAQGILDKLGTEIFTIGKVRKALDRLFIDAPQPLIRLIRNVIGDNSVTPAQIQQALRRLWDSGKSTAINADVQLEVQTEKKTTPQTTTEYSESHHIKGKAREVIELCKGLDRMCQDLAPGQIIRAYKAKYISWAFRKAIELFLNKFTLNFNNL